MKQPRVLNIKDCGYKVPGGAVYVGRAMPRYKLPTSKWGNPLSVKEVKAHHPEDTISELHQEAVDWYRRYIQLKPELLASLSELKGKELVCWCSPLPCHGDILLELANK